MKKLTQFLLITTIVILLDRITKNLALEHITQAVILIPNFLSLVLVHNNGIAFGLFSNFPYVIQAFTGVIILASLYALPKIPKLYVVPTAILIGGAAGNFIDRIIYDTGVIDFIAIRYFSVFNVADIAVSAAVVWMITLMLIDDYICNAEKSSTQKKVASKRKKALKSKAKNA